MPLLSVDQRHLSERCSRFPLVGLLHFSHSHYSLSLILSSVKVDLSPHPRPRYFGCSFSRSSKSVSDFEPLVSYPSLPSVYTKSYFDNLVAVLLPGKYRIDPSDSAKPHIVCQLVFNCASLS